jgi:hypothetical protein
MKRKAVPSKPKKIGRNPCFCCQKTWTRLPILIVFVLLAQLTVPAWFDQTVIVLNKWLYASELRKLPRVLTEILVLARQPFACRKHHVSQFAYVHVFFPIFNLLNQMTCKKFQVKYHSVHIGMFT